MYDQGCSALNLSHNRLTSDSVGEILWSIGNNPGLEPKFPHTVETLNLSNNQIDDQGAEYLNWHISSGSLKGTKHIDVSGNNITDTGYASLMKGLESPRVKNLAISLITNVKTISDKTNQAAKSTWDFITTGLKYTIEQHNKGLNATKWDGKTVRTDSLYKWKNCKSTISNVEIAYIGGLIKCSPTSSASPLAPFVCAMKDGLKGLIDPDTVWCIVEINENVDVMGDNCSVM